MTIGINGSMLDEQPSGVGVYSFNVINNLWKLCNDDTKQQLTVFTPTRTHLDEDISIVRLPGVLQSSKYGKLAAFCRFLWNTFSYHHQARKFDLLVSLTSHGSFLLKNQIITIHDLLSLRYNNINFHQRLYFRYLLPRMISRSQLIITVSETTKKDIIEFFNCPEEKIRVIHNGYDDARYFIAEENQGMLREKYGISKYLLAVGPTYPHKNFENLLSAYDELDEDHKKQYPLIIAGGKRKYLDHLKSIVSGSSLESHVKFLGYVPISFMPLLYRQARALVFPSLYEGFGIPLLEAMACGCPVLTSHTSSMPEVCGEAAGYFDPVDRKTITAAMKKIISDDAFREELKAKGLARAKNFSWKQTAQSLKTVIETYYQPTNS